MTLLGRSGKDLYFKHGDEIIHGEAEILNRDVYGDEETVCLEWISSNRLYHFWSTVSVSDCVKISSKNEEKA